MKKAIKMMEKPVSDNGMSLYYIKCEYVTRSDIFCHSARAVRTEMITAREGHVYRVRHAQYQSHDNTK